MTRLRIYLISQKEVTGWDTYDSAIICAESEDAARRTHPNTYAGLTPAHPWESSTWCSSPDLVMAKLIGTAVEGLEPGVICASFNAG